MAWPAAILIHSLDHALIAARVAQSLGCPLVLRSAPGAGGFAGVGWFLALSQAVTAQHPDLPVRFVLDCADEAGTAQGAIRRGVKHIRFSGNPTRLAAIAEAAGAALDSDERPPLDLLDVADPESACRNWLNADHGSAVSDLGGIAMPVATG